jgi:ParB family chromosome partitioning protein
MVLKLPADFAKKIAETLCMTAQGVEEFFEVYEDKQGFFVATLQPKKFLDKAQFRAMCALARDLGGEGYLQGAKAWKVPGPLAKKPGQPSPVTTSTPETPMDTRSKPPNGVAPHVLSTDKSKPPDIPNIKFIPVDAVEVPDFLPTRELIQHEKLAQIRDSIKKRGLKYAIRVRHVSPDAYELIDGYLRLKAVRELSWKEIPAEIVAASDQDVVIDSIVTNKDRIEEDPITVAKKLDILLNVFGYTQEKLAEEIGLDRTSIAHAIRLLKLPKEVQHSVALHNVSFYHALLLLTLEDPQLQVQLAKEVVDNGLSTRQLEERIHELQLKPIAPSPPEPPAPSQIPEPTTQARRFVQSEGRATTALPEHHLEPEGPKFLLTGFEVECPECHVKLLINHVDHPNGKVSHEVEE